MLILAAGLANSILLSWWLEPDGRGQVAAVLLWPYLLPYLGITGLLEALVFFGATSESNLADYFGNAVALGTLLSALLAMTGYFSMPLLLGGQPEQVVQTARWLMLGTPLIAWGELLSCLLRSHLILGAYNFQRLVTPVGYVLGSITLQGANALTVHNIAIMHLGLMALRIGVVVWMSKRSHSLVSLKLTPATVAPFLRYGAKTHVGAVSEYANSRSDQLLIAGLLPPAQLGLYVVASSSAQLVLILSQALRISLLPKIAMERTQLKKIASLGSISVSYTHLTLPTT